MTLSTQPPQHFYVDEPSDVKITVEYKGKKYEATGPLSTPTRYWERLLTVQLEKLRGSCFVEPEMFREVTEDD